jgi:iron-sulfur cluster assembly protein/iron-sulfur cluster insertion protein
MITVTESAANKVKQLLEAEGATDLALRVAVRPGGCSGFSYEMFFDGDVAADDETVTFGEIRVIVDGCGNSFS